MDNMRRLQAAPLGRPPSFKQPTTMPPFTAEQKLKTAVERLHRIHGVSKSEIMRRAMMIGVRTMINDLKEAREN